MGYMKAVTLRNVPPELADRLEQEAATNGTSMNKTVIRLLQRATGLARRRRRHHDLDHLAGSWKKQEAQEFERELNRQRQIDPELWE